MHWIASLPWPSAAEWFRWALFLILGKFAWWWIITKGRNERHWIIKGHHYNNHTADLKHCFEGDCAKLSPPATDGAASTEAFMSQ